MTLEEAVEQLEALLHEFEKHGIALDTDYDGYASLTAKYGPRLSLAVHVPIVYSKEEERAHEQIRQHRRERVLQQGEPCPHVTERFLGDDYYCADTRGHEGPHHGIRASEDYERLAREWAKWAEV